VFVRAPGGSVSFVKRPFLRVFFLSFFYGAQERFAAFFARYTLHLVFETVPDHVFHFYRDERASEDADVECNQTTLSNNSFAAWVIVHLVSGPDPYLCSGFRPFSIFTASSHWRLALEMASSRFLIVSSKRASHSRHVGRLSAMFVYAGLGI